jgi:hypothetical protein
VTAASQGWSCRIAEPSGIPRPVRRDPGSSQYPARSSRCQRPSYLQHGAKRRPRGARDVRVAATLSIGTNRRREGRHLSPSVRRRWQFPSLAFMRLQADPTAAASRADLSRLGALMVGRKTVNFHLGPRRRFCISVHRLTRFADPEMHLSRRTAVPWRQPASGVDSRNPARGVSVPRRPSEGDAWQPS